MDTEKKRKFIIDIVYLAMIVAISVAAVRLALPPLVPFVIALIVALLLKPLINLLTDKCRMHRNVAALITVILFYATIGTVVILLTIELINAISSVVGMLPSFYKNTVEPGLLSAATEIEELINSFDNEVSFSVYDTISEVTSALSSFVSNFSGKIISGLGSTALTVPSVLLDIVITVISTVFLAMDWSYIFAFLSKQLKPETESLMRNIFTHLGLVLKKYVVSYALIMLITFFEIFIGLEIIGVNNAVIIAAAIAVFDILPIVGSGLILFPWSVITIISGNTAQGIGLLLLWAFVIVVRYIIEPKIVGNNVGLHPLLTLFAMILGVFLYGGIGIVILPVGLALCQSLNEAGIISIYKSIPKQEEQPSKLQQKITELTDKAWNGIKKGIKGLFKKKK